jgi:hypothetical protein
MKKECIHARHKTVSIIAEKEKKKNRHFYNKMKVEGQEG